MAENSTAQVVWSAFDWLQALGPGRHWSRRAHYRRLKEAADTPSATSSSWTDMIEPNRLIVSLLIGAIAGALAATRILKNLSGVPAEHVFALTAAGYSGPDFVEGFMNRVVSNTGLANAAAAKLTTGTLPAAAVAVAAAVPANLSHQVDAVG